MVLLACCAVVHADVGREAGPGSRSKVSICNSLTPVHFLYAAVSAHRSLAKPKHEWLGWVHRKPSALVF